MRDLDEWAETHGENRQQMAFDAITHGCSDCCQAPILDAGDVCSECGEPCDEWRNGEKLSECCGALMSGLDIDHMICPECREHCEFG